MHQRTAIKLASVMLAVYGAAIIGAVAWETMETGVISPMKIVPTVVFGATFIVAGYGAVQLHEWSLYITGISAVSVFLLSISTSLVPGGVLPTLLIAGICVGFVKHRRLFR